MTATRRAWLSALVAFALLGVSSGCDTDQQPAQGDASAAAGDGSRASRIDAAGAPGGPIRADELETD